MSTAAAPIVSLDDYRRARGAQRMKALPPEVGTDRTTAAGLPAGVVWVYWVPVWVW